MPPPSVDSAEGTVPFQAHVDSIATSPGGRKMAWLKDSEGNILGIATL